MPCAVLGLLVPIQARLHLKISILLLMLTLPSQFNWYRRLDNVRQDVIIEMIFNLGLPRFLGFKKMIQALREDDYPQAAIEMLDSKWARQVGSRADTLVNIMDNAMVSVN